MGFFPQRGHDSEINKVYFPYCYVAYCIEDLNRFSKMEVVKQLNRFDLIKLKDLCSMNNERKIAK